MAEAEITGRHVYSADGAHLGTVTAVDDGWFKLDAPRVVDYWLPADSIRAVVEGQVLLAIDEETARRKRREDLDVEARREIRSRLL